MGWTTSGGTVARRAVVTTSVFVPSLPPKSVLWTDALVTLSFSPNSKLFYWAKIMACSKRRHIRVFLGFFPGTYWGWNPRRFQWVKWGVRLSSHFCR